MATFALRNAIPTVFPYREFVEAGGLMSYGGRHRHASPSRRLHRTHPQGGETQRLPVVQATKFEFLINLKTARALGITVPLILQAQADEVIE